MFHGFDEFRRVFKELEDLLLGPAFLLCHFVNAFSEISIALWKVFFSHA